MRPTPEVVVVGSGNAALCAAIAAAEGGADVLVLEAGGEDHFGGNSRYSAGAMRFAYDDAGALRALLADREDARVASSDFGTYPGSQFAADLLRFHDDVALNPVQRQLVDQSYAALAWLAAHGVRFAPIYDRQSFQKDGRHHFWGGLTLCAEGEGEGLVEAERRAASRAGASFRLHARAVGLLREGARIGGVKLAGGEAITARCVVLASGGFEASEALRVTHLGPEWRRAVVRGTPYNRGEGLGMAVEAGAATCGNFAGCHAVCMDVATPSFEHSSIPHRERKNFRKISYPFGLMLNARGERFVDEGADFRNYTYAQYGREVLRQPGGFAWQVFDAQVEALLYEEYAVEGATRVAADTVEGLAAALEGVDARRALATIRAYNTAVDDSTPFDPTRKDGRAARGVAPPKTNWALAITEPPFLAYRVTCGVTFSYGGLRVDTSGAVLRENGSAVPGLFAAGEIVGGLYASGYPGGSGLTAGAVFGRAAGTQAAREALARR